MPETKSLRGTSWSWWFRLLHRETYKLPARGAFSTLDGRSVTLS